jgi:glycosyltransferase involved in cell wall biosynthesis
MPTTATRPLRVAMVIDVWDDAANGAVISTRRFTELLRERGHTVTVLAGGVPAPGKIALPPFAIPLADGIMRKMRFLFAWPDRGLLAAAFAEHDLVHVQMPFYLGVRAVAIARKMGLPVVTTFHVLAENLLYNVGIRSQTMADLVYRLWLRTFFNRSDQVICPSAFAEAELRRYGLRVPTTVISNGVPGRFHRVPGEPLADDGKFVVLTVGRLATEKRHDLIVEAIRRSRHERRIQLVILGDGPLREKLKARARGLTNPPRFGFVPSDELPRYYSAANLFIHAAQVELEGMSVLESMACGAPCLIARAPKSAASQFAPDPRYLFESGLLEDLTAKIDGLLDHPEQLEEASAAAERVASDYRIERSLARLEQVYAELVGGLRRRDERTCGKETGVHRGGHEGDGPVV